MSGTTIAHRHVNGSEITMTVDRFAESEKVADGLAFLRLLRRMAMDWEDQRQKELATPSSPYSAGANGWESGSIGQFLEAAAAWAEDASHTANIGLQVSDAWRRAAMTIVAGAFYEWSQGL
jgi:hypothetical protein